MAPSTPQVTNPRTKTYEFLGPIGTLLIILGVPTTAFGLYFACNESVCTPPLETLWPSFVQAISSIAGFTEQGAEGFARVFAAIRLPNALKLRTRISR